MPVNRMEFSLQCTAEFQQSLEELKHRLTTAPVLPYPHYSGSFIHKDVNDFGVGTLAD